MVRLGLAAYRLSRLLSREDGPYSIFANNRHYWGKRAVNSPHSENMANILHCPHCLGVWVVIALYLIKDTKPGKKLIDILAIMGVQDFVQTMQTFYDT